MKKIVLITGHYYSSKRKAGFHFLAEAFAKDGYDVTFITTGLSLLSILKKDYRFMEKGFIKNLINPKIVNFGIPIEEGLK